ncbi:MAG: hypothetical protein WBN96_11790 [Gammaproteobacteria bacterium]
MPVNALAAVIFEFESVCTDDIRNIECAHFGLTGSDLVTGGFRVDDAFGAPGAISFLDNDQYELIFNFGNQSFTEQDATGPLGFNVRLDGAGFSSILGNFENANGAQLTFLTLTTVNISLGGMQADTFGGGGGWALAEGSDLFTNPVPLPASVWLFVSMLGVLVLRLYTHRARHNEI